MSYWCIFDIPRREAEIVNLEQKATEPDFWQNPITAQQVLQQISSNRDLINRWRQIEQRTNDLTELLSLTDEEDPSLLNEIRSEIKQMSSQITIWETELTLNGPYDSRNAILGIHAGAGGTESQDWAAMLLRMYSRWAERRGYQAKILDMSAGEEAGIKSVIVEIRGGHAVGYLKSEHGVHRLVRLSPFDADHARHTSFALVEVMPEAEEGIDIIVNPEDLKIDVFRSSGPGGQHMQKTSSAVRITHLPSGVTVSCQSERSQHQNKATAMKILEARLLEAELEKRAEERAQLKGKRITAGWGNQIRSYVLHPYKMVKDHRTGHQSGNPEFVLDGGLDEFINSYLKSGMSKDE